MTPTATDAGAQAGTMQVELAKLKRSPFNPRKSESKAELGELAESIRKHGVLQPIVVRVLKRGQWEIVAGHRRASAAKLAGLDAVPATVRVLTDAEAEEVALIENVQREDLNSIEVARGYAALIDRLGLTQQIGRASCRERV